MATLTRTATILRELGVKMLCEGDLRKLYLPELDGDYIVIHKSCIRTWCINRIESRATHVGRGISYGGGGGKSKTYGLQSALKLS